MGLTNRTVWLIVIAMIVSLGGLVGLQASLMKNALESNETSFRQNVMAALNSVVLSLETDETTRTALRVFGETTDIQVVAAVSDSADCFLPPLNLRQGHSSGHHGDSGNRVWHHTDSAEVYLADTIKITRDGPLLPELYAERIEVERYQTAPDTGMIIIEYHSDSGFTGMPETSHLPDGHEIRAMLVADSMRVDLISQVVYRLTSREQKPIMERIDTLQLDSLIEASMAEHGVALDLSFGVIDARADSLMFAPAGASAADLLASEFKASLFPRDILAAPTSLAIYFPERSAYLFKQIGPMLFAITLFMIVVTIGFAYSIRTIIAQRRTAQLMVDFVNNMTHEFKTPISTVALACEAIIRPDIISDRDRVQRFSHMIRDENRRMRQQAEKILQMAALEEREDRIKLVPVDVHKVIGNAVESIALQVEARGGHLTCDLSSRSPIIMADELHLTGIIYNLLDNANKYSPDSPRITVRTADDPQGLVVGIEDLGLGLKPEDKKRMFQKYFRVSHGNRHDIKGFGLGLSYVQLMMKAHRGRITVDSDPGHGTHIKLWFPRPNESTKGAS